MKYKTFCDHDTNAFRDRFQISLTMSLLWVSASCTMMSLYAIMFENSQVAKFREVTKNIKSYDSYFHLPKKKIIWSSKLKGYNWKSLRDCKIIMWIDWYFWARLSSIKFQSFKRFLAYFVTYLGDQGYKWRIGIGYAHQYTDSGRERKTFSTLYFANLSWQFCFQTPARR